MQQIHELMRDPGQHDLDAELELIDASPDVFADATPERLPRVTLPRLAHTLQRGMQSGGAPVVPSPAARPVTSARATPRPQRPAPPATPRDALLASELPSTERPTLPAIPRLSAPLATAEIDAHAVNARPELPPIDVAVNEPASVIVAPQPPLVPGAGRARLVVPFALLVLLLGAVAFWLR